MAYDSLSQVTTKWSEMESLISQEGPAALANYLAVHYFDMFASEFKKYCSGIDDLQAYELASDVIYEVIKNDYRFVKRLDRNKGHLRGLFFKIIKSRLYHMQRKKSPQLIESWENHSKKGADAWINIWLDFDNCLDRLKNSKPRLYELFVYHYLQGKSFDEIAQLLGFKYNTIKERVYEARRCLLAWLENN